MRRGRAILTATVCGLVSWTAPDAGRAGVGGGSVAHEPASSVDPFLGTGGHGHTHPAATLPFGMVQLGPDTRLSGWDGCSGYHFTDDATYGFSHTHLSGTGIPDYNDILFLPIAGDAPTEFGLATALDKSTERAAPGWYAVYLPEQDVDVELTATERTGLHRYAFPAGRPSHVIVDLAHRDRVVASVLQVVNDHEIEGFRRSSSWAQDQVVWFVARFSRPFSSFTLSEGGHPAAAGVDGLKGGDARGVFSFGDAGGALEVRVGISAVDIAGARANLDAEATGRDFDTVCRDATAAWNEALARIGVEGGSTEQRTLFATSLYHSLLVPNLFSDVDGRYLGMDHLPHLGDGDRHYTVFSLWDTFRAAHPLYTLIEPVRVGEFVRNFLEMYTQGGRLPVWELAANETDTMIGYHAVSVIADAWGKGIRDFDARLALGAMVHSASQNHFGLGAYRRQGFIAADEGSESVSRTLEYAYDDWCIARFAEQIGHPDVGAEFHRRAQSWRHLLDPDTGFFRARRQQMWVEPFDPAQVDFNYTEANAWQYSLFVPHDVEGLMDALGGEAPFLARLDALFEADSTTTGRTQSDITGLIGQYAHGNEPSHHVAWLYHYVGRPDRSAARVREIRDGLYRAAPDGLCGNEDCGQLSAWYVLAALGLYPVCPGTPDWLIGVPLFPRATLAVGDGRRFLIETLGHGDCVVAAALNGEPLRRSYLEHREIVAGGVLRLTLGSEPSDWGTAPGDRPRSRGGGARIPAAPFLRGDSARFRDRVTVTPAAADADARILWARPTSVRDAVADWQPVTGPLTFDETTTVRLVAERGGERSPVVEATLHRIPHDWTVTLRTPPAPEYSAGGPESLIDGLRGLADWRTGAWLGFQDADFEIVVDLGKRQRLERVGASFLQDIRSWIWMPSEVEVSLSSKGKKWTTLPVLRPGVPEDDYAVTRSDFTVNADGEKARYVRIRARNYGTLPDWHAGAGGSAWIFVDEIVIEPER